MQKLVRNGAVAAAALVSAIALTACGSSDKGDDADKGGSSVTPSASAGGHGDHAAVSLADVEGAWVTEPGGKPVSLTIGQGQAVLVADGGVCQGTVKEAGHIVLALTCKDAAGTDRTNGMIESADGKQLVVAWESGTKDTLTKAGALPTGLPSGIPSLPTLPSLPPTP